MNPRKLTSQQRYFSHFGDANFHRVRYRRFFEEKFYGSEDLGPHTKLDYPLVADCPFVPRRCESQCSRDDVSVLNIPETPTGAYEKCMPSIVQVVHVVIHWFRR